MKVGEANNIIKRELDIFTNLRKMYDYFQYNISDDDLKVVSELEEKCELSVPLPVLLLEASEYIEKDIIRIQKVIENTDVDI